MPITSPGEAAAVVRPPTLNPQPSLGRNPASITVGPLLGPPAATAQSTLPYEIYKVRMSYINKTGFDVLPASHRRDTLTEDDDYNKAGFAKNQKVRLHGPKLRLVIEWTAERIGGPPELPDPCAGDCNYVLITNSIATEELQIVPGGGFLHSVSGRYEYGIIDTTKVPLAAALPPFIIAEVRQRVDRATGRLLARAATAADRRADALESQIIALQQRVVRLQNALTVGGAVSAVDPAILQRIEQLNNQISTLRIEQSRILAAAQSAGAAAQADALSRRFQEGDYIFNRDILWLRMKQLRPGPLWEDCQCGPGTGTLNGAVLTGGPGTGGGSPGGGPTP